MESTTSLYTQCLYVILNITDTENNITVEHYMHMERGNKKHSHVQCSMRQKKKKIHDKKSREKLQSYTEGGQI